MTSRALVDACTGDPERTREEAMEALRLFEETGWTIYTTWPLWALGMLELSLGHFDQVDALLRGLSEGITAAEGVEPILGLVLPDEVEAIAALGDLDRARRSTGSSGAAGGSIGRGRLRPPPAAARSSRLPKVI